jgi:hypothetical protein
LVAAAGRPSKWQLNGRAVAIFERGSMFMYVLGVKFLVAFVRLTPKRHIWTRTPHPQRWLVGVGSYNGNGELGVKVNGGREDCR